MLVVGVPAVTLLFLIGKPIVGGVTKMFGDNYQEKFGKPKIPEGSVNLHARAFKEITTIGNKAEKINNELPGEEFWLYRNSRGRHYRKCSCQEYDCFGMIKRLD